MIETPFALGRHVEHDPRSRDFPARKVSLPRTVVWDYPAPVINQGQIGLCTGAAMAHCLNTELFVGARAVGSYFGLEDARQLYSEATRLDGLTGEPYEPNDRGSTGLGVCKAAQARGYITGYTHAFGFDEFLQSIQVAPALIGTNWSSSMYKPDAEHVVRYDKASILGGHEYLALGVDMENSMVLCLNSWGEDWADRGRFKIPFEDFQRLLEDSGDVAVPVRVS